MPKKPRYLKEGKRSIEKNAFRSNFEKKIAQNLNERKIKYEYETLQLPFVKITCKCCGAVVKRGTYTPDFIIQRTSGVPLVVEAKGLWTSSDRSKHLQVRESNTGFDIHLLFQRDNFIRKGSNTRYSEWCDKRGFKWAIGHVLPEEWLKEQPNERA